MSRNGGGLDLILTSKVEEQSRRSPTNLSLGPDLKVHQFPTCRVVEAHSSFDTSTSIFTHNFIVLIMFPTLFFFFSIRCSIDKPTAFLTFLFNKVTCGGIKFGWRIINLIFSNKNPVNFSIFWQYLLINMSLGMNLIIESQLAFQRYSLSINW